jgi:hypothetical protein
MTNPTFTAVSCGFALSADGQWWWSTQDFK